MELMLIITIIVLVIIICVQKVQKLNTDKDIRYITEKMQEIIGNDSLERIQVFTSDREIRSLLITINELLDYNSENLIKYNKSKISMKKMLSNISHDLKTPLTVILGYTEMLQLKSKEKAMVDKIYDKATEVLNLINKFFDLAKLESGDKVIEINKVNICEVCRTTLLDFYDTLNNKGMEVFIDIPDGGLFVLGNEEAIIRILNNLISNAIRYGSEGMYLGLVVKDKDTLVDIKVIDKGKGIDERYGEEVFERIFTLEDSRSKLYQGSGLGLTITKSLVEAQGGGIHLNSIPYSKTEFSFTLNKFNY